MNKEEKFLIKICMAYLNGSKIELECDIDPQKLFTLAKHHNLLGICHCVLADFKQKNIIAEKFFKGIENKFFDYIYIYQCQMNTLAEVGDLLTSSKIRYVLFKGAVLRNYYPVPEVRAMGDIDLLIDTDKRDAVKKLLTNSGFVCTEQNGPVYKYRKNNILLEVHTHIISEFGDEAFSDAFDNAVFDGYTGVLNDDYHFAYLISHIAHHFKFYGAGIRHILDLAVMQKNRQIDICKAMDILRPLKLDRFAEEILSVCKTWFGIGADFERNTDKTQKYLCKCGAFGSMQENKGAVIARKEIEKNSSISPFAVKLRLAFPPYEKLKNIDYIRFIDGRPWLIPYAWCYRLFYNLKHKKNFLTKSLSEIDDKKTLALAKQECDYFEEIGLL